VRVTSDGVLRPCLGSNLEFPLRRALDRPDDTALTEIIRRAVQEKPETHGFDGAFHTNRNMSRIGG
jgi:cyclic pyranopterin phosphate synthase